MTKPEDERQEAGEGASWVPQGREPTQITGKPLEPTLVTGKPLESTQVTGTKPLESTQVTGKPLEPTFVGKKPVLLEPTEVTPPPEPLDEETTPEPELTPPPRRRPSQPSPSPARRDSGPRRSERAAPPPPAKDDPWAPLVRAAHDAVRAAWDLARRLALWVRDRLWRPASEVAVQKFRALMQRDAGPSHEADQESDNTFNRERAQKWRKFEDGKKSSSYLQDDDS